MHHIGVGRTHARTPILMPINGLDIRVIHATTGQIIRELILNPAVDYQPCGVRKPRKNPQWGFEVSPMSCDITLVREGGFEPGATHARHA